MCELEKVQRRCEKSRGEKVAAVTNAWKEIKKAEDGSKRCHAAGGVTEGIALTIKCKSGCELEQYANGLEHQTMCQV